MEGGPGVSLAESGMGEPGGRGPEPLLVVHAKGTRARTAGTGSSGNNTASGISSLQLTAYDVRMCDVRVPCPPPPPSSNAVPPQSAAAATSSSSVVGCLFASSKAANGAPAMIHRLLLRRVKCTDDNGADANVGGSIIGSGNVNNHGNTLTWTTTTTVTPCPTSSHSRISSTSSPCTRALRGRYRWVAEVVTSSAGHDTQFTSPRPMVRHTPPPPPTTHKEHPVISRNLSLTFIL